MHNYSVAKDIDNTLGSGVFKIKKQEHPSQLLKYMANAIVFKQLKWPSACYTQDKLHKIQKYHFKI